MLNMFLLGFKQRSAVVVNGDGSDFVTLFDGIDDMLAIGHLTENRMFAVKVRGCGVGDEKLGAIGTRPGIRH